MPDINEIKLVIRKYLLENLLDQSSADELTDSTPLVTGGILDSISTLQLVSFLEKEFNIEFEPSDIDQEKLNTIPSIANFVQSKFS
jgi:acyl carrier protein